jgi:hypothetical protein
MNFVKKAVLNNCRLENFPFTKELAMESFLLENEEVLDFQDENFPAPEYMECECHLSKGRKGSNGRLDIVANYNNETLAVIELKLKSINDVAESQLKDYLESLSSENLQKLNEKVHLPLENKKIIGILAAEDVSLDVKTKLIDDYKVTNSLLDKNSVEIPVFGIELRRFKNGTDTFVFTDIFRPQKLSRDYTKYIWNGKKYAKNRLVLEIVRDFVLKNPKIKFNDLQAKFNRGLQGSFGVVNYLSDAKANDEKRWFCNLKDVLVVEGADVVVCNQWNKDNVQKFIKRAQELDDDYMSIKKVE